MSQNNSTTSGVFVGTTGIGLGEGKFYVTSAGKLYAEDAEISGTITATNGTLGGFTIGESSLFNTSGGSYIEITSGDYTTRLSANSIYSRVYSSSGSKGWSLSLDAFTISAYVSSVYFEKGDISVVGIRMLGYAMKNKQFQIVPHEAVIVRQLFEIYATGKYSTRDIAELLNGYGYRTLHGSLWTSQQVLATLNNEKYKGDALLYKRTNVNGQQTINRGIRDMIYVENSHDAIISPELWDKVQEVLNKKGNMKLRGKTLQVYPFTSLIKCPICGATYIYPRRNIRRNESWTTR